MSSYYGTVSGIADILAQTVHNLDVQADQLRTSADTEDTHTCHLCHGDRCLPCAATPNGIHPSRRRDLKDALAEIAKARTALVNAHGEIMGTVPSYLQGRPR